MSADSVAGVFAAAIIAGIVVLAAAATTSPGRRLVERCAPWAAASIAVAATLGSLWFSEVADFIPCRFCWFQRIAMYPLAIILPIAAFRRDRGIFVYALPVAAIGAVVSAIHVREQLFPPESTSCDLVNPCSARWVDALGVFTIPEMAGASFVLIIVLGVWTLRTGAHVESADG